MALACDATRAEAILALFDGTPLVIAAENSPMQTIISGPAPAVEEAGAVARALRVEAVTLKAPYPFHNPLLEKAAAAFATRLESVPRLMAAVARVLADTRPLLRTLRRPVPAASFPAGPSSEVRARRYANYGPVA